MPQETELTILMPCLNESETLAACIDKAKRFLRSAQIDGEIVIADNGSSDGSIEIAERSGARVVRVAERGYGAALIHGIEAARGKFVIMGDSDGSYDFSRLEPFIAELRHGQKLVVGNRFRGGIREGAMPFTHRYLGNPILSFVGRLFFRSDIGDFHCGLRGFDRSAIQGLALKSPGMEFASEMVVRATLAGMPISEVPTTLSPDGRSRPPHLRSWRDGWRHLRFLFMLSPHWLFRVPSLICLLLGCAIFVGAYVQGGSRLFFGEHWLFLASALITVGHLAFILSLISQLYGVSIGIFPRSKRLIRVITSFSVNQVLIVSLGLILVGLGLLLWELLGWINRGFANPDSFLPTAIGVVACSIGIQNIFGAFILAMISGFDQDLEKEFLR